jgi:hypothetical protein
MAYIPNAVTAGYLRGPDTELPLPGREFARRINSLLTAADRPFIWDSRPARHTPPGAYTSPDQRGRPRAPADEPRADGHSETLTPRQVRSWKLGQSSPGRSGVPGRRARSAKPDGLPVDRICRRTGRNLLPPTLITMRSRPTGFSRSVGGGRHLNRAVFRPAGGRGRPALGIEVSPQRGMRDDLEAVGSLRSVRHPRRTHFVSRGKVTVCVTRASGGLTAPWCTDSASRTTNHGQPSGARRPVTAGRMERS